MRPTITPEHFNKTPEMLRDRKRRRPCNINNRETEISSPANSGRKAFTPLPSPLKNFDKAVAVVDEATPGDLIEIDRTIYMHWALYIGDGQVIHVSGNASDIPTQGKAECRQSSLQEVAKDCSVRVNNKEVPARERGLCALSREQTIANAQKCVGQKMDYHFLTKNSEHYVTEWKYGTAWSDQAKTIMKVVPEVTNRVTRRSVQKISYQHLIERLGEILHPSSKKTSQLK